MVRTFCDRCDRQITDGGRHAMLPTDHTDMLGKIGLLCGDIVEPVLLCEGCAKGMMGWYEKGGAS